MPVGPSYRDGSMPISSTSDASLAAALTGAGRVCGTSARSEPNVATNSTPSSCASPTMSARVRLPAEVRLDAEQDHDVAVEAGDRRVEERVRRPLELPRQPVLERHLRAHLLEVVEVLRVDRRELLRAPLAREIARAERRSLAAVVPAAEAGEQDGAAKVGPRGDDQLRHSAESSARLPATGRQSRARGRPSTRRAPPRARRGATTTPHGTVPYVRYCSSPIAICASEDREQRRRSRAGATGNGRAAPAHAASARKTMPKTATARTCQ